MKYVGFLLCFFCLANFCGVSFASHSNIKKEFLDRIRKGKIEKVKKSLSDYSDMKSELINYKGTKLEFGDNALIYAAKHYQPEIFKLLVNHGADLTQTNDYGETPLMIAAQKGVAQIIEYYIAISTPKEGALVSKIIVPTLNELSRYGRKNALHYVLENNEEALDGNRLSIALSLIRAGIDITAMDAKGNTPLYHCFKWEKKGEILINAILEREDIKTLQIRGEKEKYFINRQTPRSFAANYKTYDRKKGRYIDHQVEQVTNETTPVMKAIELGVPNSLIRKLIDKKKTGFDASVTDCKGEMATFYAVRAGNFEILKALLIFGYNPEYKNQEGATLLDLAKAEKKDAIVEYLEKYNEAQDASASTPKRETRRRGIF